MSQNQSQEWVVVGSYSYEEATNEWVSRVMATGFTSREAAWEAAERMTENAPDIHFDVETAAYCQDVGIE